MPLYRRAAGSAPVWLPDYTGDRLLQPGDVVDVPAAAGLDGALGWERLPNQSPPPAPILPDPET